MIPRKQSMPFRKTSSPGSCKRPWQRTTSGAGEEGLPGFQDLPVARLCQEAWVQRGWERRVTLGERLGLIFCSFNHSVFSWLLNKNRKLISFPDAWIIQMHEVFPGSGWLDSQPGPQTGEKPVPCLPLPSQGRGYFNKAQSPFPSNCGKYLPTVTQKGDLHFYMKYARHPKITYNYNA